MPQRPLRRCTTPGCPHKVEAGRCPIHARNRLITRQRDPGATYHGDWPRRRLDYLARHPVCVLCGRAATVADHHPHSRRQLIRAGVADPDADQHLRPLCKPCHDRQTGLNQPGGWNTRYR
ncbi:MAG: HNH endonuclease [Actinomycetota bacterium]|nr:HNH endonuclease [Actinomycetota bacterium]